MDDEGQRLLKEVADAGNGEFAYVSSEQDLQKYMRAQYEEMIKQWEKWRREGTRQTTEIAREKKEWAKEIGERIREKNERERDRMLVARNYLHQKYGEDPLHSTNLL